MSLGHTHVLVTKDGQEHLLVFPGDQGAIEHAEKRQSRIVAVYTRAMTLIWGHDAELDLRES